MDLRSLERVNQVFRSEHPGESKERRPIHVVYGGAHLFKSDICRKLGDVALRSLSDFAPDADTLASVTGMEREVAATVYPRVVEKLTSEPVEDYRIDFEDGYGHRSDAEEDQHAETAAFEAARALKAGKLPAFFGIRIKSLDQDSAPRALRTLEEFLMPFREAAVASIPENFVVTLPKITIVEQVRALIDALELIEQLRPGPRVKIELMMETPQSLLILRELVRESKGRCAAVHFGPYDYTGSLGITAAHQSLAHPACDFARSMMQVTLAARGIGLSDGPTHLLPIPPYRGEAIHGERHVENRAAVHRAWKLHYDNVRRGLDRGFYQGWDVHPAQLPMRYAAVFAFFTEGLKEASDRLRNFMDHAAQATRLGSHFDDAATGQGLLNYFLRAVRCGAIQETEVQALSGLSLDELRTASFGQILEMRRSR